MKTVVSVIFTVGAAPAQQLLRIFDEGDVVVPMSTADAICLTMDEMEAAGYDLDAISGWAIVAKRGLGADALLPPGHAARVGQVQEVPPCAA
jgi:N6-adenosine-specific RNA methylase IME4